MCGKERGGLGKQQVRRRGRTCRAPAPGSGAAATLLCLPRISPPHAGMYAPTVLSMQGMTVAACNCSVSKRIAAWHHDAHFKKLPTLGRRCILHQQSTLSGWAQPWKAARECGRRPCRRNSRQGPPPSLLAFWSLRVSAACACTSRFKPHSSADAGQP